MGIWTLCPSRKCPHPFSHFRGRGNGGKEMWFWEGSTRRVPGNFNFFLFVNCAGSLLPCLLGGFGLIYQIGATDPLPLVSLWYASKLFSSLLSLEVILPERVSIFMANKEACSWLYCPQKKLQEGNLWPMGVGKDHNLSRVLEVCLHLLINWPNWRHRHTQVEF